MDAARQIAVDLEQFEIRLGTERVRLLPVAGDVFCLNDARGPLVRALKFEERARLLTEVSDRDVVALVADAALVSSGVSSDEVRIAASLALAGGAEEAPTFPDCAQFVEERYGWDEKRIAETMAIVIDGLCSQMVQQDSNGWKQIVFQKTDADLGSLISQMASKLSQRAVAPDRTVDADSQSVSPSSHGSVQSVSSALPIKRAPFRVLAVNTDQATHTLRGDVVVPTAPDSTVSDVPTLSFPKLDQFAIPQIKSRAAALSTSVPTITQDTDFPPTLKAHPNHTNFSLSQSAVVAKTEPSTTLQPDATFPVWRPFATSVSKTSSSSEPVGTSSRGFGATQTTPQFANDWLAEVAQQLEAECDMRGIDP